MGLTLDGQPLWQDWERFFLAPFAATSGRSRGRRVPEPEHPYRSPFQRDRDRIVHTNAFRRLEYKTQVFINHEGDHYRTRLTHTIEVSLTARTLARALRLNEDLAEAIALAHDLGHPPFGHAGEEVLNDLLKAHGGFEHNRQSLRIVDFLEIRYSAFRGLNLTAEVREGLAKKQWFGPGGSGATLEAQICDLSDSITYDAHDVDDGVRSGLIRWHDMRNLAIWRRVPTPENETPPVGGYDVAGLARIRALQDCLVGDLIQQTLANLARHGVATYEDLRAAGPLAAFSPEIDVERRALERFLFGRLYRHPRVAETRRHAEKIIRDLFGAYIADPRLLPYATRERIGEDQLERVVCDYVAGMTDRFALVEHVRIFGDDEREVLSSQLVVGH
jgi:dGTPase